MKTRITGPVLALAAAGFLAPVALADDPDLTWNTIDAGGVFTSSYTSLSMSATLGQPDVGAMYGDDLSVNGTAVSDLNGSGLIEPVDVAMFINAWMNGLNGVGC